MIRIVADANISGHIARLVTRIRAEPWREFWEYLQIQLVTFSEIGLTCDDTDAVVWQRCQTHQVFLLTNNRNDDGPESLEATIRNLNTPQSLPVFTIGNADNMLSSNEYADRVIDQLLRYLLEVEDIRGTGRLFLP